MSPPPRCLELLVAIFSPQRLPRVSNNSRRRRTTWTGLRITPICRGISRYVVGLCGYRMVCRTGCEGPGCGTVVVWAALFSLRCGDLFLFVSTTRSTHTAAVYHISQHFFRYTAVLLHYTYNIWYRSYRVNCKYISRRRALVICLFLCII